jgi:MFS family permease
MKDKRIFYGWYIVTAGLLSYAFGYGARYSFSVIFPALLEDFKWPRDITAAMLSVHFLVYGCIAPIAGHLINRVGPRKTMVSGVTLLALGLALSAWGSKAWHFYLTYGVMSGAGLCLIGAVPFTIIISQWFERKRGLALAVMFFGTGGAYAFYPATAWLIHLFGWRYTFLAEALIVGGIMIPVITRIVRYHPQDMGLVRDGLVEGTETSPAQGRKNRMRAMKIVDPVWVAVDWRLSKAMRTKRFWLLALTSFSLWGIMQHIMSAHHVAFAIDVGYPAIYASSVLALFGVMFAFGSLAAQVSDRIGRELTLTIGTLIGITGIVVLSLIRDTSHPWMLYTYALSLGSGIGICTPTIAASITDIFQGRKAGSTIGFMWFAFAVGGAIGPWLGGWLFELQGNYRLAFMVAIAMFAVACAAIWLAAPRKVRCVQNLRKS